MMRFWGLAGALVLSGCIQVYNPTVNADVRSDIRADVNTTANIGAQVSVTPAPLAVESQAPQEIPATTTEVMAPFGDPALIPLYASPSPVAEAKVAGAAFDIDSNRIRPEDGVALVLESLETAPPYHQTATFSDPYGPFAFYQVPVGVRLALTATSEKYAPLTRYFTISAGQESITVNLGGPPSSSDEKGSGYYLVPKSRLR